MVDGSQGKSRENEDRGEKQNAGRRLTLIQAQIVAHLLTSGSASRKDVQLALQLNQSSLSRAISQLLRDGLITRDFETQDARRHVLAVTGEGKNRLRLWRESLRLNLVSSDDAPAGPDSSGYESPTASRRARKRKRGRPFAEGQTLLSF